MEINQILQGDALVRLKKLPDESIDMVITSPPYYGLRNYGVDGQIGLESSFAEFIDKILAITAEIKRVLKPTGSFWMNFGDCYGTGSGPGSRNNTKQETNKGNNYYEDIGKNPIIGYQKSLLMQPERIALKMIDEQKWLLRNKIKWAKQILVKKDNRTIGSVMPSSVKDRFNESGEELYFFTKNQKYYFNLDEVRMSAQTNENRPDGLTRSRELQYDSKRLKDYSPQSKQSGQRFNYRVRDAKRKAGQPQFIASNEEINKYNSDYGRKKQKNLSREEKQKLNRWASATSNAVKQKFDISKRQKELVKGGAIGSTQRIRAFYDEFGGQNNPAGKNLPTIWQINPEPHNFQRELGLSVDHFAIFPQALVEIPIKAASLPGGIILDPFMGSGTVAVVAKKLGRNYLGIELNPDYIKIAEARLKALPQTLL